VRSIAQMLSPGSAIAAVLLEHPGDDAPALPEQTWAEALADAVARLGGTAFANDFVEASRMSELIPRLIEAAVEVG
jgi:hypothetical protein